MIHLHVTVEGYSELAFIKNVLAPHLAEHGVLADARCVLFSKDNRSGRTYRGGLLKYSKVKCDIQNWMKEFKPWQVRFTTMFDLYALPHDFPGYEEAKKKADPYQRVATLERCLKDDLGDERLIPYIQLHEFEALILAAPQTLDMEYLEHRAAIGRLVKMMEGKNPELINDGPETAPSKRILQEIPDYDKVNAVQVVKEIGLPRLREACSHFGEWLTKLETLSQP